jgi:hypothetical protein
MLLIGQALTFHGLQLGNREIASAIFKGRSVTGDDWQAILCPEVEIE